MCDFTPDQIRLGNAELLKLANILDVADAEHAARGEPTYEQATYSHECDTPACALGHARAARGYHPEHGDRYLPNGDWDRFDADRTFAIDNGEWSELFNGYGCGGAVTAKDAAAYIRSFVAKREAALARVSA